MASSPVYFRGPEFQQCSEFSKYLMSTKSILLHNVPDPYWGTGTYGKSRGDGQNLFGQVLMELRHKHKRPRIAILGLSYVARLQSMQGGVFGGVPAEIRYFARGGMRADNVPRDIFDRLLQFQPDYAFIQLGANDISITKGPKDIVDSLCALVDQLKDNGVKDVFIGELLIRGNFSKSPGLDFTTFLRIRNAVNGKLFWKTGSLQED